MLPSPGAAHVSHMSHRLRLGTAISFAVAVLTVAVWSCLQDPLAVEANSVSADDQAPRNALTDTRNTRAESIVGDLAPRSFASAPAARRADGADVPALGLHDLSWQGRVIDGTGAAIAGARVVLLRRLDLERLLRQTGADPETVDIAELDKLQPIATVESQRDGRFSLRDVRGRSSATHLAVQHRDYAAQLVSLADRSTRASKDIRVILDRGRILSGRVVDEQGVGIVGATLQIEARTDVSGFGPSEAELLASLVGTVRSGPAGGFALQGLPAGNYRLIARRADYLDERSATLEIDKKNELDCGQVIMRRARVLHGRVVDPNGEPVEAAVIEVVSAGKAAAPKIATAVTVPAMAATATAKTRDEPAEAWSERIVAKSSKDGRFVLELPTRGATLAIARHPEFEEARFELTATGTQDELRVRMTPRASITGIVIDRSTNEPIEDFTIRARRVADGIETVSAHESRAETMADWSKHRDGKFTLRGLLPGRYVLEVYGMRHIANRSDPIEVRSGARTRAVTIALRRGVVIEGRTIDARSRGGLAGVRVELFKANASPNGEGVSDGNDFRLLYSPELRSRRDRIRTTMSRHGGSFSLGAHEPGRYRVVAIASARPWAILDDFVVRGGQPRRQLRLELARGASVFGALPKQATTPRSTSAVVPSSPTSPGRMLASSSWIVLMHKSGNTFARRCDDRGRFEFRGLRSGDYRAVVATSAAAGRSLLMGQRARAQFHLGEGERLRIDPGHPFRARVSGRVLVDGRPQRATVQLIPLGSASRSADLDRAARGRLLAHCDGDGNYAIDAVPSGQYALEVRSRSAADSRLLFTSRLTVGQRNLSRAIHIKTGSLVFEVRDASGVPVPKAQLRLVRKVAGVENGASSPIVKNVEVRSGRAQLDRLPTGTWRYHIADPDGRSSTGTCTVRINARPGHVRVSLPRSAR